MHDLHSDDRHQVSGTHWLVIAFAAALVRRARARHAHGACINKLTIVIINQTLSPRPQLGALPVPTAPAVSWRRGKWLRALNMNGEVRCCMRAIGVAERTYPRACTSLLLP